MKRPSTQAIAGLLLIVALFVANALGGAYWPDGIWPWVCSTFGRGC